MTAAVSFTAELSAIHTAGMLSGGAGSWGACRRWIDQYGADGLILLFTDVGGDGTNPHVGEDPDTLRFLEDAAADLGAPLVKLRDGRDIWDVFREKRWLGNTQLAHCSWELKTGPARAWIEQNAPGLQRIIVGIDKTEDHRAAEISAKYAPYEVVFPLMERPHWWKPQLVDMLRERGITPPRMYRLGFAHADAADGIAVKATGDQGSGALFAQCRVCSTLNDAEHQLPARGGLVATFPGPTNCALDCCTQFARCARVWRAIVEHHGNVGAEFALNGHGFLGSKKEQRAIQVRSKLHAVRLDLANGGKAENLKSTAVGQDRRLPVNEGVQPACGFNNLHARPDAQVIGIS